jgi:hypothetical protein
VIATGPKVIGSGAEGPTATGEWPRREPNPTRIGPKGPVVTSLIAELGGVTNPLGWTVVGLRAIFTLGYGYFRFVRSDAASRLSTELPSL